MLVLLVWFSLLNCLVICFSLRIRVSLLFTNCIQVQVSASPPPPICCYGKSDRDRCPPHCARCTITTVSRWHPHPLCGRSCGRSMLCGSSRSGWPLRPCTSDCPWGWHLCLGQRRLDPGLPSLHHSPPVCTPPGRQGGPTHHHTLCPTNLVRKAPRGLRTYAALQQALLHLKRERERESEKKD